MAPKVMTISELAKAIKNGEDFLDSVHMMEVESEASIMRKILTSDMKPYEAYLLGRTLHYNLIGILEDEYQFRHTEAPEKKKKK